jgi:hypothetical protein
MIKIVFTAEKIPVAYFLETKIGIHLSLGLHEGRPSYSPQQRTFSNSKHEISSLLKFFFVDQFCNDCACGTGSG